MSKSPPPPYSGKNEQGHPPQGQHPLPQGQYPPLQGQYPPPQGQHPPSQAQYSPPQGQYSPPKGAYPPDAAVVTQQPIVIVQASFQTEQVPTICPYCRSQIVTSVRHECGTYTWLLCAILCVVGLDLGCCLIPFCSDGCQDAIHTCPNCQQTIARYKRM